MKENTKLPESAFFLENDFNNERDRMSIHLHEMIYEMMGVHESLQIVDLLHAEVEERIEQKKRIGFSAIRTNLIEGLYYRIVLGLSKIITDDSGYTLARTVNELGQLEECRDRPEYTKVRKEIKDYLKNNKWVERIKFYRNVFFAHLDKVSRLSSYRIDPANALEDINREGVETLLDLMIQLYHACFRDETKFERNEITKAEVLRFLFPD